jgi:hypothetical protein
MLRSYIYMSIYQIIWYTLIWNSDWQTNPDFWTDQHLNFHGHLLARFAQIAFLYRRPTKKYTA